LKNTNAGVTEINTRTCVFLGVSMLFSASKVEKTLGLIGIAEGNIFYEGVA
jgi:hypothetical protein